jgi:2-amino-4-hydroxy-6-hydroxymethyldihydropteridine diphosphokinase
MEKSPSEVVIMLGGNMKDTRRIFTECRELINAKAGEIIKVSSLYVSEPWGGLNQSHFLNQAIKLETYLDPLVLLHTLLNIETGFGRKRIVKNGPRTLDIDILYYNDLIINSIELQLPHPRLHLRRFNLIPLLEISPNWNHPVYQKSVAELLQDCPDTLKVTIEH